MNRLSYLFLLIPLAIVSCRKEAIETNTTSDNLFSEKTVSAESAVKPVVSSAHWYGYYKYIPVTIPGEPGDPGDDPDIQVYPDSYFIRNGVAQLPSGGGPAFTYVAFDIPSSYTISGDSVIFQTVVQNAVSNGGYNDYDVILEIEGTQHYAELHFVADSSDQVSNRFVVGNAQYNNLPQLNHYFSSFQTIKWVMKKNGAAAYINNKLAYRFTYGTANRIGTIKTITVGGKGYAVINNVTLLNSYSNKKIMVENFDIDGQSHTVFYQ